MSTEAPAKAPDNEPFWAGLLAMLRALILGRRLPPDQLRRGVTTNVRSCRMAL